MKRQYTRLRKAEHPYLQTSIDSWKRDFQSGEYTLDQVYNNAAFDFMYQLDLPFAEAAKAFASVFGLSEESARSEIRNQIEKNGWQNLGPEV